MKTRIGWAVVLGALSSAWSPALAQTGPTRPYASKFEGTGVNPDVRPGLSFAAALAEAYDDNLQAEAAGQPSSPIFQQSGFFTAMAPTIAFESRGDRIQVAANAASNLRYYGDRHLVLALNHSLGVGVVAQLGPQTSLFVNQAVSYAPAYLYGLFATTGVPVAGDVIPPATDYAVNDERSHAFATTASLTRNLSKRTSVSFNSNIRITNFVGGAPGFFDLHAYDAGGRLLYSINSDVKLRLGYIHRQAQYVEGQEAVEHTLDVGIEYSRPLSRTRRSTMAFSIGPTVAKGLLQPVNLSPDARQYRFVADALFDHQMGRTWSAHGSFHRGLGYVEGLANPVFTNAATLGTGGFLNRRTDLTASAAVSTGDSALSGTPSPFTSYTGDVRLRVAVSARLAAYAEYLYYYYNFNRNLPLPPSIPLGLTRNGVRVGLMLWVPITRRR